MRLKGVDMSSKLRTIDNLGIEASNQYAKGQQALDRHLIDESRFFPPSIKGGLTPYIPSESEENFTIFTMGRATVWAAFSPPMNYADSSVRLFTYLFIPSLGTSEQLQTLDDRLETLDKKIHKDRERDYKKLCSFIKHLIDSSRTFELIKARCNQYQRG